MLYGTLKRYCAIALIATRIERVPRLRAMTTCASIAGTKVVFCMSGVRLLTIVTLRLVMSTRPALAFGTRLT